MSLTYSGRFNSPCASTSLPSSPRTEGSFLPDLRTSCRPALEKVHGLQFTPRGLEGLLEGLGGFVPAGPQLTDRSRQRSSAARQPQPTKALQSGHHPLQHMQTLCSSMHNKHTTKRISHILINAAKEGLCSTSTPPWSAVWPTDTLSVCRQAHTFYVTIPALTLHTFAAANMSFSTLQL